MTVKVSVILPVYNVEKYFERMFGFYIKSDITGNRSDLC